MGNGRVKIDTKAQLGYLPMCKLDTGATEGGISNNNNNKINWSNLG